MIEKCNNCKWAIYRVFQDGGDYECFLNPPVNVGGSFVRPVVSGEDPGCSGFRLRDSLSSSGNIDMWQAEPE